MTNEKLAALIAEGGNDEVIPLLWEKIKNFAYMLSDREYKRREEQFIRAGIETQDIKQAAFPAMIKATASFNADRGSFVNYYTFFFKTAVSQLLKSNRALNESTSLDAVSEDLDGNSAGLYDVIGDSTAEEAFKNADKKLYLEAASAELKKALRKLPEKERFVIYEIFFEEKTMHEVAKQLNCSLQNISQIKSKAFRALRSDSEIRRLYGEYERVSYIQSFSKFRYSPEYFEMTERINRLEQKGYLSYGKRQAMLYLAEQKYKKKRGAV